MRESITVSIIVLPTWLNNAESPGLAIIKPFKRSKMLSTGVKTKTKKKKKKKRHR